MIVMSEDEIETLVVEKKGSMDMFYRNPVAAIEKRNKEKLRQANMKEACDKNLKASYILFTFGTK